MLACYLCVVVYDVVQRGALPAAGGPAQHNTLLRVGGEHLEVSLLCCLVEMGRHLVVVHVTEHGHHLGERHHYSILFNITLYKYI